MAIAWELWRLRCFHSTKQHICNSSYCYSSEHRCLTPSKLQSLLKSPQRPAHPCYQLTRIWQHSGGSARCQPLMGWVCPAPISLQAAAKHIQSLSQGVNLISCYAHAYVRANTRAVDGTASHNQLTTLMEAFSGHKTTRDAYPDQQLCCQKKCNRDCSILHYCHYTEIAIVHNKLPQTASNQPLQRTYLCCSACRRLNVPKTCATDVYRKDLSTICWA